MLYLGPWGAVNKDGGEGAGQGVQGEDHGEVRDHAAHGGEGDGIHPHHAPLHGVSPPRPLASGARQAQEWGGYFVVGGHERLIRMLQTTRRNYPVSMCR